MCALENVRHERFAQGVAAGEKKVDAFRNAFRVGNMSDKTQREKACRLAKRQDVRARIRELTAAAEFEACVSIAEFKARLSAAFRAASDRNETDKMVRVGALLAKAIGADSPSEITIRSGGVTDDFRPPPPIASLSDEDLLTLIKGGGNGE